MDLNLMRLLHTQLAVSLVGYRLWSLEPGHTNVDAVGNIVVLF